MYERPIINVKSFLFLNNRCEIPPHHPCMFKLMIRFILCFMLVKVHIWGTFSNVSLKDQIQVPPFFLVGPLFWECSHLQSFSLHHNILNGSEFHNQG
jgi:hypothetical protein